MERTEMFPEPAAYGRLPWQFEPLNLWYVESMGVPTVLCGCPDPVNSQPVSKSIENVDFSSGKTLSHRSTQEVPQPLLVSKCCLLPTSCWAPLWRDWGTGNVLFFHMIRRVPCPPLGLQTWLKDSVVCKSLRQYHWQPICSPLTLQS